MTPLTTVIAQLGDYKKSGAGYLAKCPAHEDANPSLSISEGDGGKVLLHCHAGCSLEAILAALGLTPADLFPKGNGGTTRTHQNSRNTSGATPRAGLTLAQYADAKKLPIEFLQSLGCDTVTYQHTLVVRIPYVDKSGQVAAVRYRLALYNTDKFRWRTGAKLCLYGLWQLTSKLSYIVLVEGESDCHTLWWHDIPAVGVPGANTWKDERDAEHLHGISTIYVIVEPDKGGETVKAWIRQSTIRDRVKLVSLGEHKDPSGLYLADPDHFRDRFHAALEVATSWTDHAEQEHAAQYAEAWEQCRELATAPSILERFAVALEHSGVAGERRIAQLLFLAVTSRVLSRPISIAVKGPSSGGKSYLVEIVLSFFPERAYYALSAMSEHALAYSDKPLQYRMLVIYEAAGMAGDFTTYLLRSLLSEGRLRYETVEKTKDGLQARLIEREGPTGLIVTTTAVKLHSENETRLLSLTVADTQEQTRDILSAIAEEQGVAVDRTPWQALQTWIEHGEHRVTIPYAKPLAGLIPPLAVRLRRDFSMLLNLIRTHAILHQATRDKDSQGRIIARLDDYAVIHALVYDLVAEGVEATVPATVRDTVTAVAKIISTGSSEVSVARLAQELALDKSATSRRVRAATERGFLKNAETKRGLPARLVLGDPLPQEHQILPTPAEVLQCCSDADGDMPPHSTSAPDEQAPVVSYPPKPYCNTATVPGAVATAIFNADRCTWETGDDAEVFA